MKGKNAILTGSRGGIGRAVLKLFAENGVNIWVCLRNNDEEFSSYIMELEHNHGVWLKPVYFDLMDEDSIKAGLNTIAADQKPVDILVNNAGRFHRSPLQTTLKRDLHDILEINYIGPFLVMQLVSRLMIRRNKGSIVNIVSIAGIEAMVASSVYGSSKAALALTTSVAAKELGPLGIRVNAVAPGIINTSMMSLIESSTSEAFIAGSALRRAGDPSEIAQVVCFLASDAASFITGQIIRVDGGL